MWKLWSIVCASIRFLLRLKCFSVGITGLSFVRGKSWEGCDRAFYCAACKLAEGIAPIMVCHVIDIEYPSLWSIYSALYLSVKKKSLQRRRKSEKYGFLSGNSAMLGKKFPTHPMGNKHESTPDPLLSSFIYHMPFLEPKCIPQDECFREDASSATSDVKRYTPFCSDLWGGLSKNKTYSAVSSIRKHNIRNLRYNMNVINAGKICQCCKFFKFPFLSLIY